MSETYDRNADLANFSIDELEKEINDRKRRSKVFPLKLANPDFTSLIKYIENSLKEAVENEGGYLDEDFEHYVFEVAMTALYGQKIWEWYKENITN